MFAVGGTQEAALAAMRDGDPQKFFVPAPATTGVPISYRVNNLKDRRVARIQDALSFTIQECAQQNGNIFYVTIDSMIKLDRAFGCPDLSGRNPADSGGFRPRRRRLFRRRRRPRIGPSPSRQRSIHSPSSTPSACRMWARRMLAPCDSGTRLTGTSSSHRPRASTARTQSPRSSSPWRILGSINNPTRRHSQSVQGGKAHALAWAFSFHVENRGPQLPPLEPSQDGAPASSGRKPT